MFSSNGYVVYIDPVWFLRECRQRMKSLVKLVTIFSIISNKKKEETPLDYVQNKFMPELSFSLLLTK